MDRTNVILIAIAGLVIGSILGYVVGRSAANQSSNYSGPNSMMKDNVTMMMHMGSMMMNNGQMMQQKGTQYHDNEMMQKGKEQEQNGMMMQQKGQGMMGGNQNMMQVESSAIYVAGQKPGNTLSASLITLKQNGFVVIHEDSNGTMGKIIGQSKLVSAGSSNNVLITLSRPVKDGEQLYAMLHQDDGDGIFKDSDDAPVTGSDNNPIYMLFRIDKTAQAPGVVNP